VKLRFAHNPVIATFGGGFYVGVAYMRRYRNLHAS
jgi:hypothetical protein